jgi:hypothetical protein
MSIFKMYEDISDKPGVVNLRARSKPITVHTHSSLFSSARTEPNDPGATVVGMKEAVELARATFVKRLSHRVGLTNESGEAVKTLPLTIAHAAFLNPLYATEKMVSSSLFTKTQLERACSSLTAVLEKRYELTSPQDEGEDGVVESSGFACLMAPSTVQQSCDKAAAEVRKHSIPSWN